MFVNQALVDRISFLETFILEQNSQIRELNALNERLTHLVMGKDVKLDSFPVGRGGWKNVLSQKARAHVNPTLSKPDISTNDDYESNIGSDHPN